MTPRPLSAGPSGRRPGRGGLAGGALRALAQARESVIEPLPLLLAASAAVGAAAIVALDALLRPNAVAAHLNTVISFVLMRELAPLLATLILALRSGAAATVAIGSEGALRGAETGAASETSAEQTAADHAGEGGVALLYIAPRALGLIVSSMLMTACIALAALVGGFGLVQLLGRAPEGVRLASLLRAVSLSDVALALGQAALAGVAVALICAFHGRRAARSAPLGRGASPIARAAGNAALQGALASVAILMVFALVSLRRVGDGASAAGDEDDYVLTAASSDAYGTAVGASVKVRGVQAGSVTDVALVHDPARPDAPVRITMRIRRRAASFLFDRTVAHIERIQMGNGVPPFAVPEIELRTAGDAPLASGSIIDAVGDAVMSESFVQLARDVAAVRSLLDGLAEPLNDLRTITRALARTDGAAGRFINDPKAADGMMAMLDGARGATASLQKVLTDARALSAQAAPLLTEMQGASKDGRDALAGAALAARDLPRVLKAAERTLAIAEELVVNLRAASAYAPELARKVDVSLEETNRVVDAAQRSIILRSTVPDRQVPRTEEEVRPPAPVSAPQGSE